MNAAKYREILENNLFPASNALGMRQGCIFQQDNDPKHTAKITSDWFVQNKIDVLNPLLAILSYTLSYRKSFGAETH